MKKIVIFLFLSLTIFLTGSVMLGNVSRATNTTTTVQTQIRSDVGKKAKDKKKHHKKKHHKKKDKDKKDKKAKAAK